MTPGERTECAAILRAVADLVEAGGATGSMDASVTFWATHADDQAAAVRTIAQALPLRWSGKSSSSTSGTDWYDLTAATEGAGSLNGVHVRIHAKAEAVATEAGTRTVTEWAPAPGIAALLSDDPEERP